MLLASEYGVGTGVELPDGCVVLDEAVGTSWMVNHSSGGREYPVAPPPRPTNMAASSSAVSMKARERAAVDMFFISPDITPKGLGVVMEV